MEQLGEQDAQIRLERSALIFSRQRHHSGLDQGGGLFNRTSLTDSQDILYLAGIC
mgnify:CR=1 FL=1